MILIFTVLTSAWSCSFYIHILFAVNASDADVVIHSSDNVEFRLHKKNLECTTGAFPSADTPVDPDEIVRLTESAATLEILFQFIYPRRFPSLKDLDFDSLISLAEAAEKYEVAGLIYACEVNLRRYLTAHPKRVLEFSAKHDHLDLVDELKPILVETPLSELTEILPDHVYKPWVSGWSILTKAHNFLSATCRASSENNIC
ncbi:hypothetical protein DFH05DRAFT_1393805 [Lentinula detonsa]|uniref:BTB domain-containing protein n=1 Tax=Lentinula detonsa TaxID=2804962 RepID=A0A9W8P383_9AGAR|nr:hypothetical protein DFH05DRAFT_1393805 [Lentinula detonsa]